MIYESRRILRGAAALDPTESRVWEVLGLCSFSTGSVGDARECWEKAMSRDPESPAAIWSRELASGSIARGLNEYRTALAQAGMGDYARVSSSPRKETARSRETCGKRNFDW
jgi:cytochrome c-type biogenesis protein CcmH/NrfG